MAPDLFLCLGIVLAGVGQIANLNRVGVAMGCFFTLAGLMLFWFKLVYGPPAEVEDPPEVELARLLGRDAEPFLKDEESVERALPWPQ